MSRIGKLPISVPSGVEIKLEGKHIIVKGSKGTLEHDIPELIDVKVEEGVLTVTRANEDRNSRALHGLTRSLLNNMIVGVTEGYTKKLEIVGTGYRVVAKGKDLEFSLGFSHTVPVEAPEGITFAVEAPTKFSVSGIDKQLVGEIAARIRRIRKPEPYKGKGIRYAGEYVRRKAGKAGK